MRIKMLNLEFFVDTGTSSPLARVREFLAQRGIESYVIGGYVRDGLMGRATADIDIVVAGEAMAIAAEVADAFGGHYVLMDEVNGVARVVLTRGQGAGWHLDFSSMRGSIEEDLAERDFTIDAIAINLEELGRSGVRVIDPFDGGGDLRRRLVRAVNDEVFQRDPARLLRAVRLRY